jgi:hypothetical protein
MADRYVKNTGSNTSPYDTWAKAATTLATAVTGSAAGDNIYVSSAHSASGLASQTLTFPGTASNPLKVISVNDSAAPPTTTASGGAEALTASANWLIGPFGYVDGMAFSAGTGTNSTGSITLASGSGAQASEFRGCTFTLNNTGSASRVFFQSANFSAASRVSATDCTFVLGNQATHGIGIGGRVTISGGSVSGPTSYTTGVFQTSASGRNTYAEIDGMDLSGVGAESNLVSSSTASMITRLSNCKLPSGWTGSLFSGTRFSGQRVSIYNCDNADTNYRLWIEDYAGSIRDETTIVRSGGASDGTTPIAWRMASNADANSLNVPLRADPIVVWNETIGSPVTVTVEVLTDGVTLTDNDCWLNVDYLGTNGFPLGLTASNKVATILAAPTNHASSSATWTTTGISSPVKQKLSVTFTPQEVGFLSIAVRLGKPSTTVYVCPKAEVS